MKVRALSLLASSLTDDAHPVRRGKLNLVRAGFEQRDIHCDGIVEWRNCQQLIDSSLTNIGRIVAAQKILTNFTYFL